MSYDKKLREKVWRGYEEGVWEELESGVRVSCDLKYIIYSYEIFKNK